jgi:hypothetical protein
MLILLAVILLGSQSQIAPRLPPQEDIIVVGERMRRVKLVTKVDRRSGLTQCIFKRRSGDDSFDNIMCDSAIACTETVTANSRPKMEVCMGEHISAYVDGLVTLRDAAKASR